MAVRWIYKILLFFEKFLWYHNAKISLSNVLKEIFYKEKPKVLDDVIYEIEHADLIIFSMGSLYTSLLPNLICDEVKEAIDNSKADIMYVCNIMTQPGETDNYKASDHVKVINKYLNKRKVNIILVNNGKVTKKIKDKYLSLEQKDQVIFDKEELKKLNLKIINDNFINIKDDVLRHNTSKLGFHIYSYLLKGD